MQNKSTINYVKKSAIESFKTELNVPQGLVGPSSTLDIKICGHPCSALLDSGSQVTIIFEKWYNQYLSEIPIHPVNGLAIWWLSESSYPYKGYVVVDLEIPKDPIGVPKAS